MKRFPWWLFAACIPALVQAQGRFSPSKDGVEVTDSQTGLVWQRCTEGQSWNGSTCAGIATEFTYYEALAHANNRAGWRVPDIKELAGLVDRARYKPAIDIGAFPGTPSGWFWSSSPSASSASAAWFVFFTNGHVDQGNRRAKYVLRLVKQAS